MIRRCILWTAAMLAVFVATAQAAEEVYNVIPENALAFGAVNRIAETSAKLQKLAQLVGAPPVGLLELAKGATGVNKGLDETRSAAFVIMAGSKKRQYGDDAAPVFLIPVNDYKLFLESWKAKPAEAGKIVEVKIAGEDISIGNRGGYAVMAPKQFRYAVEKVLQAKRSIADAHPQMMPWLLENDGVEAATPYGIKLASSEMQKELKRTKEMFSRMGEDGDMSAPIVMTTTMEMYIKVLQWAEKDIEFIAVGAKADKENTVRVTTRTRFAKDSAFAASLAKIQPPGQGPLAGIPSGQFVAAGGGAWSDALTQSLASCQGNLMKQSFRTAYGLDEKKADELVKKVLDMPKGIRSMSMMVGPGQPGEAILSDMLALYGVEDSKKYLDDCEKYYQGIDEGTKDDKSDKEKKLFSVKKTEVGGRPALETEMALAISPKLKESPEFEETMGKIFGAGGKFKMLMVAVDDRTVAISLGGSGPLVMRSIAALKQPSDSLAADADIAKTAKMLPDGSQWVGYVSPSGAVAFVKWVVDTMSPEAGASYKPNIPEFPACPPIGFSVKAVPNELQTETVVTSAVLEAIGKYVGIVQSAEHPEVP